MLSLSELQFAKNYPFTPSAAKAVKESASSLEGLSFEVLQRAKFSLKKAAEGKDYSMERLGSNRELLLNEVLAFPAAKILLSIYNDPRLYGKFAFMHSKNCFKRLESNSFELEKIAEELSVKFTREGENFSVPLLEYVSLNFREDFMKLVNRQAEKGKVFLTKTDFARVLSAAASKKIFDSLPVQTKGFPKNFREAAKELREELRNADSAKSFSAVHGKPASELFPPCFDRLYKSALDGKKLSHLERFNLATFLTAVNFSHSALMDLFRKMPNYKEKTASYHLKRIRGSGEKQAYSPASCAKMRQYRLCFPDELCRNVRHPLQYYKAKRKTGSPEKFGQKNAKTPVGKKINSPVP